MTESAPRAVDPETSEALAQARTGREDLHGYLHRLEHAVAKPASGRTAEWAAQVHETLVELGASFERHIEITERPDGLFDEVMRAAPRLSDGVQRLAEEHRQIRGAISRAIDAVRDRTSVVPGTTEVEGREAVLDVLARLMRHRQRGADLVYETYQVDIGVGD